MRTEVHKNFVLNALRRVGRKAYAGVFFETVDGFNEPYRADRNEIFLIFCGRIVFSDYVRNEPQVVQNELFARFFVAFCGALEAFLLFGVTERRRKVLLSSYSENKMRYLGDQIYKFCKHKITSFYLMPYGCPLLRKKSGYD